jgi:hypothetical protein
VLDLPVLPPPVFQTSNLAEKGRESRESGAKTFSNTPENPHAMTGHETVAERCETSEINNLVHHVLSMIASSFSS